jgi:drug/metabolite transporter (DMT)-like permease|tara:strand:- start:1250 stop:2206 length:957 start_codon:yes stop_codon:yes gene_type:complete
MAKSGLGRGLEEIFSSTEGPDLSSFVTEEEMPDSPRAAVIWMIFGSFCFGTMNALVKWTSDHADVWMIIMVRSAVIAFGVAAFAATRGISLRINDKRTMLLRCSVGLLAMILYFTALGRIPIGQAVTLQYTGPLFVALLSGRILAERVSSGVAILVLTAFVGILLIISPELGSVEPDALLALGSGFFAALAYMYVRELRKTDSPATVVFWFAAFSVCGSIIQAAPSIPSLDSTTIASLVGVGIGAGGGQIGITMAYHKANAAWVSAFSYLTVLVATFYGFTFFGETLSLADWVGGFLIIGSGIALMFAVPPEGDSQQS